MIDIIFPEEWPERLAFLTAIVSILAGLALMLMPRRMGYIVGITYRKDGPDGLSEVRGAFGGAWVGLGVACILLAQPFSYFTLGLAFVGAVIGRVISVIFDRALNLHCLIVTVIEVLGAYFTLGFALGAFGLL